MGLMGCLGRAKKEKKDLVDLKSGVKFKLHFRASSEHRPMSPLLGPWQLSPGTSTGTPTLMPAGNCVSWGPLAYKDQCGTFSR